MAKTPSQKGLYAAVDPRSVDPALVTPGGPDFRGQDPWGNQGTPGGPVMSPEWSKFFDMLNQAAPGGITAPRLSAAKTKPMSNG